MRYIVSSFFTPKYVPWAQRLVYSLMEYDQPHDLLPLENSDRSWQATTLLKANHLLMAMDRNPGRVVIFVDADSTVHGDLSPLAGLEADVALGHRVREDKSGTHLHVCSNAVVVKPNNRAHRFVREWVLQCANACPGDDDRTTLARTLGALSGVSVENLEPQWLGNLPSGNVIAHYAAGRSASRAGRLTRAMHRVFRRG